MGSVEGSSVLLRKKAFPQVVGLGHGAPSSTRLRSFASHCAATSGMTAHSRNSHWSQLAAVAAECWNSRMSCSPVMLLAVKVSPRYMYSLYLARKSATVWTCCSLCPLYTGAHASWISWSTSAGCAVMRPAGSARKPMGLAAPFRSLAKARPKPRFLSLRASRISLARFLLSASRSASACFLSRAASSLHRSASAWGARWDCMR